jgi:hypothetical protein
LQQLTYVLFQLDEARRHIAGGRLEELRLALLLLDNAAELQIGRRVREELSSEDLRERIRAQALRIPESDLPERLGELVAWQPLTPKQKGRLDRYFNEKLNYLSMRHTILDRRVASVLAALHRHRNEAYHEGRVRRETIRTAAVILLEANCQLLLSIFRVSVYASNEDYSWLEERFGIRKLALFDRVALQGVVESLRDGMVPTVEDVVGTLTEHLRSRVSDLGDALDFAVDNTGLEDRAHALKVAQLSGAVDRGAVPPAMDPVEYVGQWTMSDILALDSKISAIEGARDRLEAFEAFSAIELQMEPLERDVLALAGFVDGWIQHQTDVMRGK